MNTTHLLMDHDAWQEILNIASGAFYPLNGFLTEPQYRSVVSSLHLPDGQPWTIPVTLDLPENRLNEIRSCQKLYLEYPQGNRVAEMEPESIFKVDLGCDLLAIFGTEDRHHPGVAKEARRSPYRIGGKIKAQCSLTRTFPQDLFPEETKKIFRERNWKMVVGFQTRNPPHRAHEHLQRIGLEIADGLFIQPLIGWKKKGDFTPEAILEAYELLIRRYYPVERVVLGTLRTPMRYAGPREAVFHALIRRNYGCTHFIIGRDHAGVGAYYGKYDGQNLAKSFNNLGIEILALAGPFFCHQCGQTATEKSCGHREVAEISATRIRQLITETAPSQMNLMREDVFNLLTDLFRQQKLFHRSE